MPLEFLTPAEQNPEHRQALLNLQTEYMAWVMDGMQALTGQTTEALLGCSLTDYVHNSLPKVCAQRPPQGQFYLLREGDAWLGMGGLRQLSPDCAEIKRLYLRPACRGRGFGQGLLARLLADARAFGYSRVQLDSAPFMQAAHRLYRAAGFRDCPAYAGVEVPQSLHPWWHFMALPLPCAA